MLLQSSARNNVRGRQFVIDGLSWKKKMVSAWAVWGRREEKTFRHCLWNGKKMSVFFSEKRISILGNVCFEEKAISCTWAFVITEAHSSLLFFFMRRDDNPCQRAFAGGKDHFLSMGFRRREYLGVFSTEANFFSLYVWEEEKTILLNELLWGEKTIATPKFSFMRSKDYSSSIHHEKWRQLLINWHCENNFSSVDFYEKSFYWQRAQSLLLLIKVWWRKKLTMIISISVRWYITYTSPALILFCNLENYKHSYRYMQK